MGAGIKFIRGSVISSCFILAAIGHSQAAYDLSKKITFSARAASAKSLFEQLRKETGVPLVTSVATANEVLLIDVTDVALSDLMTKIAEVAGAEWKQDSEGYRLIRPQALMTQQDREYVAFRASLIKKELDRMLQDLNARPNFTADEAKKAAEEFRANQPTIEVEGVETRRSVRATQRRNGPVNSNTPISRAIVRVLTSMSAMDLAAIPDGSRIVYALTPTRMQRQLPSGAVRAIQQFASEQQTYAQNATEPPTDNPDIPRIVFFGPDASPRALQGGVSEALLVIFRGTNSDSLQIELRVADQTGQFVGTAMRFINPVFEEQRGVAPEDQRAITANGSETALALSADAKEHAALFGTTAPSGQGARTFVATSAVGGNFEFVASPPGGGSASPLAPEKWRAILANPDANEPFSFEASELFLGLAKSQSANLVACLPDGALAPIARRAQQSVTPSDLVRTAKSQLGLEIQSANGWTTVRPRFFTLCRRDRVDRAIFANLLRSVRKEGRLSLDALSRYAINRRNPPFGGLEAITVSLIDPAAGATFMSALGNWKMVQLYGQLDPIRRKNLADGALIRLGGLSSDQAATLYAMVFNEAGGPMRQSDVPQQGPSNPRGGGRRQQQDVFVTATIAGNGDLAMPMMFGNQTASLLDERTEYLPAGVPSTGSLTMRWEMQPAVLASSSTNAAPARYFTARQLGTYMGVSPAEGGGVALPAYDKFVSSTITRMTFTFTLLGNPGQPAPGQIWLARELSDAGPNSGATIVSFDQLPQDFRVEVERSKARLSEARARGFERGRARGGTVNPPPKL